jgi:hypothetical protein
LSECGIDIDLTDEELEQTRAHFAPTPCLADGRMPCALQLQVQSRRRHDAVCMHND